MLCVFDGPAHIVDAAGVVGGVLDVEPEPTDVWRLAVGLLRHLDQDRTDGAVGSLEVDGGDGQVGEFSADGCQAQRGFELD